MLTTLDLLGLAGNSISIIFFFMPTVMIINMFKTKDTSKIPYLLFLFTILNCLFWLIYGIKNNAWPIWLCNGCGVLTNVIFMTAFLTALNKELFMRLFFIALLYTSLFSIFTFFNTYTNDKTNGTIAMIMNILMFAAPLQKIGTVFKNKDNSYIPIWISVILSINCVIWCSYGYLQNINLYVMIPNFLGLLLSILQICLWFKFRQRDSEKNTLRKSNDYSNIPDEDPEVNEQTLTK